MVMITARAIYGLKNSGDECRAKLAETLKSLVYKSYKADADFWMKRHFNPNGEPYYKYMLWYVDDLIHIGFNPKEDKYALNMIYRLKKGFGRNEQ